jgi:hypothetical protein
MVITDCLKSLPGQMIMVFLSCSRKQPEQTFHRRDAKGAKDANMNKTKLLRDGVAAPLAVATPHGVLSEIIIPCVLCAFAVSFPVFSVPSASLR